MARVREKKTSAEIKSQRHEIIFSNMDLLLINGPKIEGGFRCR